ncbi:hypothetical protein [Roseateles amylovorans]|uniref:Uncharacterized protein n=1 Tax=Roseateles amylovorans TaxID=2978473 RepID=A0ABY6B1A5_9BURK|nr:hypothetical protein [Roseateles amylovorans]UXH79187.1 hypothetical protein N4261_04405 [Roseateles amylovorans]
MASRVPGSLGMSESTPPIDPGTLVRATSPQVRPVGTTPAAAPAPAAATKLDDDTRALAAVAYGEGSTDNVFEEMAAIANVLVRQQKARGYATISAFIKANKTYAFAAHDGNKRYGKLIKATDQEIAADTGMDAAVRGARNALSATPKDYANGAYFWDGADIKSNYANHPKVLVGIKFTDPKHNIYNIAEKNVPDENFWMDANNRPTKSRGKWNYKFESTAAYGGTIFWKYNEDFLKATKNKEYN